jgi:4-amino-4-deoxy-L-arabinose transferase-like glycosyltransferase
VTGATTGGYRGLRMAVPELKATEARTGPRQRLRTVRSYVAAVPAPLAALLAIVVIAGVVWALLVPPWQSPDEGAHFAYAQSIAERHALPGKGARGFSTDQLLADDAVGASELAFRSTQIRPDWSKHDETLYLDAARRDPSRSDGGGSNPAASNPPLYYVYADLAYWATYSGNALDRYYAMRLWGISLLVLTVVGAWLLIGEVLGPRRLPQLAGAAVVGLLPMTTFISTSVNPDALVLTLWTFALWLGARVIKRAARPRDVVGLCAVTAGAILTKGSSYALVPAVALAMLIGWSRSDRRERRRRGVVFAVAATVCAAPVLGWIEVARSHGIASVNAVGTVAGAPVRPFNLRQFVSYIWQFYLPRLPEMSPDRVTPGLPVYDVWLREGWGVFGWLEVRMPNAVYAIVTAFMSLVAIASAAIVVTFRDRLRWELIGFFAVALAALLFGLHLTEYRSLIAGEGPILQGRYLLPVLGLFGLAVALVVGRLPASWRAPTCGVLIAGMLLLQLVAIGTVGARYYT